MRGVHALRASILILAAGAALAAGSAAAQCVTVDPVHVPDVRVDPLDAAGPGELVQPLAVTFRRADADGASPVTVRWQIVDEDSQIRARIGRSVGPLVEWQSEDSIRDVGALRNEAFSLLSTGTVRLEPGEQTAQRDVRLRLVDLRQDLPAGVYREQFSVRLWCGEAEQSLPFEFQGVVAASVTVPNVLSASVAGASLRGEIDFLDFSVPTRTLNVSVRSTGPYVVSARSENGGVMVREGAAGRDAADRIPYAAAFDGRALDLDQTATARADRAGLAGRQIPLEVTVDDVSTKRAGQYSDTLFLTLTPVT